MNEPDLCLCFGLTGFGIVIIINPLNEYLFRTRQIFEISRGEGLHSRLNCFENDKHIGSAVKRNDDRRKGYNRGDLYRTYGVELTDEEYLYLLTEQLFDSCFSFNRLLLYKPELAREICNATDGTATMYALNPYLIIMDEVVEDAKKIKEMEK